MMSLPNRIRLLAHGGAMVLVLGRLASAQTPATSEAVQRELQVVQDQLARATLEFEGSQQSRSIVLFDEVIARLENVQRPGPLPPRGRDLLAEAYERRGRAYFNIGLQEKASENFRLLIQLKPDYVISREKVSPKIVDLFNSVKKVLVGYVAVSSKPAGARVTLVGGGESKDLGLTDFFPQEVLAGEYTVEIAKEGFRTESKTLNIAPRATETIEVDLVRTLATLNFVTEPVEVQIWIDGDLKITTGGSLAPDLYEVVRGKGLEPSRASARTGVANLPLGNHTLEFRRKCYETVRRTLETARAEDYEVEPVRLDDSLASLRLTSDPPGAKIYLNGEAKGVTPAELEGICSGKVRVEVKHQAGKFIKDLALAKDEAVSLDCPIRPTLAFLGVVADSPAGERYLADADEKIRENLGKLTSLNFIPAPKDVVDRILDQEKVTRKGLVPGSGTDPDLIRKVTEKLATTLEVQGFLIAVLPEERLQHTAMLHLLAAANTMAEVGEVTFVEGASYARFIAKVDQRATSYRPWSGLITVDSLLVEGVPVLRVVPGSPAAQAGIQVGEVLNAVDGKPIAKTAELLALIEQKRPKDKVALQLKGAQGSRAVELTLGQTAQEIPLFDPNLLYNKVMMDLRLVTEGYPGTEQAAFAWLNLALSAMHFQDFAAAHDYLVKARNELPQRPGISQGTALYYLGVALERLSYKPQAIEAFRAATGFKESTLINNDGPAVAPLAARRAGS
jgi:tetratricopeptide (TPR) repeat protein